MNVHSGELGAVSGNSGPLAGDLGRVDEVLEDLLVDDGQGPGSGSHLLDSRVSSGLSEHSSLSKEDDVLKKRNGQETCHKWISFPRWTRPDQQGERSKS